MAKKIKPIDEENPPQTLGQIRKIAKARKLKKMQRKNFKTPPSVSDTDIANPFVKKGIPKKK